MKSKLIYRGAEAELWLSTWHGLRVVIKKRVPREFLVPELDLRIRKLRTRREVRMLYRARQLGIHVPAVYYVDLEKSTIYLEYVEGPRLADLINQGQRCDYVIKEFGKAVGLLHSAEILHGDLTTANVLIHNNTPVLIDFGLSDKGKDIEDFGTEIHLFQRAIETAHPFRASDVFRLFIEGYKEGNPKQWRLVLERAEDISRRGRYIPPEKR